MAKAPVPGLVKTRLAVDVGDRAAADLAAAALLDTIAACTDAVGPARCRLALAGGLSASPHGDALARDLAGWTVVPQHGDRFDERLARAHEAIAGPVVQVGMDTPQITPALLRGLIEMLAGCGTDHDAVHEAVHDAVLAPAEDGGWWALGLTTGRYGGLLRGVPMSTPRTYEATLSALRTAGLSTATARLLVDADHLLEARRIAAAAPYTRFARTLAAVDLSAAERMAS